MTLIVVVPARNAEQAQPFSLILPLSQKWWLREAHRLRPRAPRWERASGRHIHFPTPPHRQHP
jgi:hypothetical protein